MNSIALFFASGDSLYPGAALLALAVVAAPFLRHEWLRALRSTAAWMGVAMIVIASPPVAWWAVAIFTVSFLLWWVAWNFPSSSGLARMRVGAAAALVALLLTLSGSEIFHRGMPEVQGTPGDHLVVIGDSISAGLGSRALAWPTFFQQQTKLRVENLSQPGAGVAEALAMAREISAQDSVVVIEIGGNDLLSGTSSGEFSRELNLLLSELAVPGRAIVMFELPLLPHKIGYGLAQRRLATRYGVYLIPKHFFTDVLGSDNATVDGLHLSDAGARCMATLVGRVLCRALACR